MPKTEIDNLLNTQSQPTDIDLLKQENESLSKRLEEAENAIMTLMDLSIL
jgi:hypothetical protein